MFLLPQPNYQIVETIPLKIKHDPTKKLNLMRLQSNKKTDLKNFTPPVKLIRKDPSANKDNNNNAFSKNNMQISTTSNTSLSGGGKNSQISGGGGGSGANIPTTTTTTPSSGADASL